MSKPRKKTATDYDSGYEAGLLDGDAEGYQRGLEHALEAIASLDRVSQAKDAIEQLMDCTTASVIAVEREWAAAKRDGLIK